MLKTLFLAFLLLPGAAALAQQPSKADLEKERAAIQKEIDDVKQSLDETKRNKKASLAQLNQVQRRLQLRERQIGLINQNINFIEGDINQSWREISKWKKELDTLKLQYAQSIVYSYKNRSNYDFLNFIFSAGNFNDALKRVAYLKSYRTYREEQAVNIHHAQDVLQQKIAGLSANREKKTLALKEQSKQREVLEEEKHEKDAIVSKLKTREKELMKDLADKKKQDMKLATAITAAIRRARDEATREAAANAKRNADAPVAKNNAPSNANTGSNISKPKVGNNSRSVSVFDADPEAKALSDNFEKNRGSLPWPVTGNVSMHYGPQKYFGEITYDNPGITIEAGAGASVKAVFDGDVTAVISIGPVQGVILKHGKYFTSYSNLSSVSVSKGQQIKRGQVIGKVAEKDDGKGDIEFLISNDANHNFDPEKWLR
jgi:septal ring factor EnvC (AmiA/AmiB activator)